jgi:hypothetical protein
MSVPGSIEKSGVTIEDKIAWAKSRIKVDAVDKTADYIVFDYRHSGPPVYDRYITIAQDFKDHGLEVVQFDCAGMLCRIVHDG